MKVARDHGFALLVVLWALVLVSLLLTQVLASGRSATKLAQTARNHAMGRAAADGAIAETIFRLLGQNSSSGIDGSRYKIDVGGSVVQVTVRDMATRINPNLASTNLLAGLFQAAGLAAQQASTLAGNVTAWRSAPATAAEASARLADYRRAGMAFAPPGKPFEDVDDLGHILGMTPMLLAAVRPYLSLYPSGDPDPAIASPLVRQALKLAGQNSGKIGAFEGNFPVVSIEADAIGPGHSLVERIAIVTLPGDQARTPYDILAISDGQ